MLENYSAFDTGTQAARTDRMSNPAPAVEGTAESERRRPAVQDWAAALALVAAQAAAVNQRLCERPGEEGPGERAEHGGNPNPCPIRSPGVRRAVPTAAIATTGANRAARACAPRASRTTCPLRPTRAANGLPRSYVPPRRLSGSPSFAAKCRSYSASNVGRSRLSRDTDAKTQHSATPTAQEGDESAAAAASPPSGTVSWLYAVAITPSDLITAVRCRTGLHDASGTRRSSTDAGSTAEPTPS